MRRVTRPVWLLLLASAIGVAAAVLSSTRPSGEGDASAPFSDADADRSMPSRDHLLDRPARGGRARATVTAPTHPASLAPGGVRSPKPAEEIVGHVVDAEGKGIVARVALVRDGWSAHAAFFATTSADGSFRIRPRQPDGPEPIRGVIALCGPSGLTAPLTSVDGEGDPVRIVALRAVAGKVTVVDERGQPVTGVCVWAGLPPDAAQWEASGPWIERTDEIATILAARTGATTDGTGTALLLESPTPTTKMFVDTRYGGDLIPMTASRDAGSVTVRRRGLLNVSGTVREAGGDSVGAGTVWWRLEGNTRWAQVPIDADGTFGFRCEDEGVVELCARTWWSAPGDPVATTLVPVGSVGVSLWTEAAATLELSFPDWPAEMLGRGVLLREPCTRTDSPPLPVYAHEGLLRVSGLDPSARYTLWIEGLQRLTLKNPEIEPEDIGVLQSGLSPRAGRVEVPLIRTREIGVLLGSDVKESDVTGRHWMRTSITATVGDILLPLVPFRGKWCSLPPGGEEVRMPVATERIQIDSMLNVTTEAEREEGRLFGIRHTGEAAVSPTSHVVTVDMVPVSGKRQELLRP